MAEEQSNIK